MAEPSAGRYPEGEPTLPLSGVPDLGEALHHPSSIRLFGTPSFFRLWLAQVVSSLGDWIGLVAIISLAARVGGNPETSVALVLSARMVPGFFFGSVGGVLVDRWDRKRVMVVCDIGRGSVLAFLPFVDTVQGLILASFLLEVLTLLWGPAKEASVPNLVRRDQLATANSLSLVAAYGTFPVGSLIFSLLAGVAKWLDDFEALRSLRVSQESVAIWFDVGTFFLSALMLSTLTLTPRRGRDGPRTRIDLGVAFRELAEGWRFIGSSPLVRSVIFAISAGLVGGGILVPLGPVFSKTVLGGGTAGFGLLLTALGSGMAVGIIGLSVVQRHLPHERIFVGAVLGAGGCILAGAAMSTLPPALGFVAVLGVCAGAVYILGFTILGANVDDEFRGRIFATFYTLIRFCLLFAFTVGPILSRLLGGLADRLFDGQVAIGDFVIHLPGSRLALWLGGVIILVSGTVAAFTVRQRADTP